MESKICTKFNIEKCIISFHRKYSDCKGCNRKRGLKRYYGLKDKTSNQRKTYYEKKR